MPDDSATSRVFAKDPAAYGPGDAKMAFEQYKMYVGDIGRLERLRRYTNTFYLSANTALTAALATLGGLTAFGDPGGLWLIACGAAGLALGHWWRRTLQSYMSLAKAKWDLVTKVEETLPLRFYQTEWENLKGGPKWSSHTELTEVERRIPVVFMSIYLIFMGHVAYSQAHSFSMHLAAGA